MNLKKKIGKVLTSKSVGTGPSSYEKRIYLAAVLQRLRNTGLENERMNEPILIIALCGLEDRSLKCELPLTLKRCPNIRAYTS